MHYLTSRLTPHEQRILAYVCTAMIVAIPLDFYLSGGLSALHYVELPIRFWIDTTMEAVAWLFCVWYIVGLLRRS